MMRNEGKSVSNGAFWLCWAKADAQQRVPTCVDERMVDTA